MSRQMSPNAEGPSEQEGALSDPYFQVDGKLFVHEDLVEVGDVLRSYKKIGENRHSQICSVDYQGFMSYIAPGNRITVPDVPCTAILKVFDPLSMPGHVNDFCHPLGQIDNFHANYVIAQKACIRELEAYAKLGRCDLVPKIYSYGRMVDVFVSVGRIYWRVVGPYILMEEIAQHPDLKEEDITPEILQQKVIPAYHELHKRGVLHNKDSFDSWLFTPDMDLKIIDFRKAELSDDKEEFKTEIDIVYTRAHLAP